MKENNELSRISIFPLKTTKNQWIGFSVFFIVTWVIASWLWYTGDLDKELVFSLNNQNFSESFTQFNKFISGFGMSIIAGISLCMLLFSFKNEEYKKIRPLFILTLLSFAVGGISGDLLKLLFSRARPILEFAGELSFLTSSDSPSFPSGHATKSVALAVPLLFYMSRSIRFAVPIKILVGSTVLLVCLARIVLGAHYLSDVLAGMGLAVICLPLAVMFTNRILSKMTLEKYEMAPKNWIKVYIGLIIVLKLI